MHSCKIVGEQLGVNNITGYELYVNGKIPGRYAVNDQGFLIDGSGTVVDINGKGVKFTVVPPSYRE